MPIAKFFTVCYRIQWNEAKNKQEMLSFSENESIYKTDANDQMTSYDDVHLSRNKTLCVVVAELAGPRFDESGNIIPHSILGDVDDFLTQAVRYGDLVEVMDVGDLGHDCTKRRLELTAWLT
jgi:hypothetical protein